MCKWRMSVDFNNWIGGGPNDSYPLPHIDQLDDVTSVEEVLSFMDASSIYNQ